MNTLIIKSAAHYRVTDDEVIPIIWTDERGLSTRHNQRIVGAMPFKWEQEGNRFRVTEVLYILEDIENKPGH